VTVPAGYDLRALPLGGDTQVRGYGDRIRTQPVAVFAGGLVRGDQAAGQVWLYKLTPAGVREADATVRGLLHGAGGSAPTTVVIAGQDVGYVRGAGGSGDDLLVWHRDDDLVVLRASPFVADLDVVAAAIIRGGRGRLPG
jgi:hypothetical protein